MKSIHESNYILTVINAYVAYVGSQPESSAKAHLGAQYVQNVYKTQKSRVHRNQACHSSSYFKENDQFCMKYPSHEMTFSVGI